MPICGRGRPASVDVESINESVQVQNYLEANSNAQPITKKSQNQGKLKA